MLSCMVSDTIGPDRISKQLIDSVGAYLGRKQGLALRERVRAVSTALRGLGLTAGSRVVGSVLLPALYGDALEAAGVEFLPADVGAGVPVLTPETVSAAAPEGAEALIVDTTLGYCPDLEGLSELGIPMIEDVSEGLGAHTGDKLAGTFGRFTVVGLEPEHVITAGGGALVLAGGRKEHTALREVSAGLSREVLLPDVNSALGLTQTKELERFLERRREVAGHFSRSLASGRHSVPVQPGDGENVFVTFPVLLETGLNEVVAYARKHDVEVVSAFEQSLLATRTDLSGAAPSARGWHLRCARFPLYPLLKNSETERIGRVLSTLP